MKKNQQKFLKQIDERLDLKSVYEIDKVSTIMISFLSVSLYLLAIHMYMNIISNDAIYVVSLIALMAFAMSLMVYMSSTKKRKFKKEFGVETKEDIISLISNNCEIKEIKKYYSTSSVHFKNNYLDVIFEKEIANSLGLKEGYNKKELLKKIECKNKLEIENI